MGGAGEPRGTMERSTAAAKKLGAPGYRVLDYKGGLKEWKEKGNTPAG